MKFLSLEIPTIAMTRVTAGKFRMGRGEGTLTMRDFAEAPRSMISSPGHEVFLEEFEIGTYPVTNQQYAVFVEDTGHRAPPEWKKGLFRKKKTFPEKLAEHPVAGISWNDAYLFCAWLRRRTGEPYHLPTEAQWEKSAAWDPAAEEQRQFPWGEEYVEDHCNFLDAKIGSTTPVGKYSPAGDSPYGCADLSGNVAEWCNSLMYPYPYCADDGTESADSPGMGRRVNRGGDWYTNPCSTLIRAAPDSRWFGLWGFRVARSNALEQAESGLSRKHADFIAEVEKIYAEENLSEYSRHARMANELIGRRERRLLPQVVDWLSRALQAGPNTDDSIPPAHALYNRAWARHQLGENAAALADVKESLALDGDDREALCAHRDLLLLNDEFEEALRVHVAIGRENQGILASDIRNALLARAEMNPRKSNEILSTHESENCVNFVEPFVYLTFARNFMLLGEIENEQSALVRYCLLKPEAFEDPEIVKLL